MVIQSVVKSGAVSIFPKISPAPVVASSPDSPLQGGANGQFSYNVVNADGIDGAFFQLGLELKEDNTVFFYELKPHEHAPARLPVADRVFVVPNDSVLFLEASRPITQFNKESLTTVLDLADDAGCTSVQACIAKDAIGLKDIMRSYIACGFVVSEERGDFVAMQFDI